MENNVSVAKFGGLSIAQHLNKISEIVNSRENNLIRKYVVVSAPGKRHDSDNKLTGILRKIVHNPNEKELDLVIPRLISLQGDEKILDDLKRIFSQRISKRNSLSEKVFEDSILAFGEEGSAKLLASKFNREYIDPKGLFLFDENGNLLEKESINMIRGTLGNKQNVVIPGFYGYNRKGEIVTFPEGGSDITGAYIGIAMKVDVYENFTDSAIAKCDPKIVNTPTFIDKITFRELRNLTYFEFEIVHRDIVRPLMKSRVPLHVRSTAKFPEIGTHVTSKRDTSNDTSPIVGVAYKSEFHSLVFYKYGLNEELGGLANIYGVLADNGLNVEPDNGGIDTCNVLIHDNSIKKKFQSSKKLIKALESQLKGYNISLNSNIGCLVFSGIGLSECKGIRVGLESLFDNARIDFDFVSRSEMEYSMMYKIFGGKGEDALNLIYNKYLR